ncbi:hypothetical protein GM415_11330 [Pseudodesulfovibrio cashew]|uniref:Uncharacterized protein n=1 Tax=Pseudodesulfovibrio cashew TaxID=2678688 RepID=A0A6I6JI09_9BACT|nr:hypothetical protein [Pseudodesulfovibrio cashew]QGY40690.1 hypothetical protein GM415_11330 [Pseudodesulfovibrio cashew]
MKILTALLFVCLFALPAAAFVPDDGELAAQVRKIYGPLSSWEAEMTFPEYPGVAVHLWYARGKWRQEWRAGTSAVAVGRNGNVVAECTPDGFPLSPMFVWMTPDPVGTWKSWGVDNATRNFGFCDEQPCYLLGAEPGDETLPTVRLNNEDMAVLLVRYASGGGMISVGYGDYRTLGGFRVPQTVTTTFADGQVLEAKVKWIAVNRADGEELYDRDSVGGTPCLAPPAPFDLLRDAFRYPQPR